jgi:hypothetical protein
LGDFARRSGADVGDLIDMPTMPVGEVHRRPGMVAAAPIEFHLTWNACAIVNVYSSPILIESVRKRWSIARPSLGAVTK